MKRENLSKIKFSLEIDLWQKLLFIIMLKKQKFIYQILGVEIGMNVTVRHSTTPDPPLPSTAKSLKTLKSRSSSRAAPWSPSSSTSASKGKSSVSLCSVKSLWQIRKQSSADVRLWVYPDELGSAVGYLYQDDGFTFDCDQGHFNLYRFEFESEAGKGSITVSCIHNGYSGQILN